MTKNLLQIRFPVAALMFALLYYPMKLMTYVSIVIAMMIFHNDYGHHYVEFEDIVMFTACLSGLIMMRLDPKKVIWYEMACLGWLGILGFGLYCNLVYFSVHPVGFHWGYDMKIINTNILILVSLWMLWPMLIKPLITRLSKQKPHHTADTLD